MGRSSTGRSTPVSKVTWETGELIGSPAQYEKSAEDAIPRFDFTVPVREGHPDTADIVVEVSEHGDGEIDYNIQCLCHACQLLDYDLEFLELFRPNVYGKPTPGVYYLKAWYAHYPATISGPEEWESGWEIAPSPEGGPDS